MLIVYIVEGVLTIRNLAKIIFNTTVGAVLIFIWLQFVDIKQIFGAISKVNLLSLIPIFFFMFISPVIRAIRLKIFLNEIKTISTLPLIFLNIVAMMLNFLIPIRAGEVVKGIYLNTRYGLPLGKSVVWIFLDRFVDFLVVLVLAAGLLLIIPTSLSIIFNTKYQALLIIIIFSLALGFTYLAIFQSHFIRKIVNFLRPLLVFNSIKIYFERFTDFILDSFSILNRHPKDLFLLCVFTVLAYAADAAIWYFTFVALGFPQDFIKMYLGQLLSALTYLIPAAPGYIGSAEASGALILSGVFGIEVNLASSMIVLFHILSALFILVFGVISVFSLKIDLGLILRKALRKGD